MTVEILRKLSRILWKVLLYILIVTLYYLKIFFVVLNNADLATLERTTKSLVEKSLVHSNNSKLVDSMSNLLLTDIETKRFERTGLLVDWVAELEIEIIGNSPNVQVIKLINVMLPANSIL